MVSLTAEYALRAVSYLAVEHDEPRTVHQIAEATRVPPDYLSKVLQELSKLGMVRSQRGLYGGFTLVRKAADLTVLDVIRAVSPLPRIQECPLHREGHGPGRLCPLHQLLDDAAAHIERAFADASIADIVRADGKRRVLGLPHGPDSKRDDRRVTNRS